MQRIVVASLICLGLGVAVFAADKTDRPNVVWITVEDISPNLGCYGDAYALSPNIDKLAKRSVRYTNAFSNAGVCAVARTTLITGMYAASIGSSYMRCAATMPEAARGYPSYLRDAGYYTTNNVKTDYNWARAPMDQMWDDSSRKAHYKNRPDGKPFFAIFNITTSHESKLRDPTYTKSIRPRLNDDEVHDPAKARVPAYMPDIPEVRKNWAQYYDSITAMDKQVGQLLDELDKSGLADNTIIVFYGDHGGGMPRSKRWLFDSSTRVPLLVCFPKKYQNMAPVKPGESTDRLVSFVDFGPTLLSLCGIDPPDYMQGKAFLGEHADKPRDFVYQYRDRMDERYDFIRSVHDGRFNYIRNFHPERPWFHDQACQYNLKTPALAKWMELSEQGKLKGDAAMYMAPTKPAEQLFDTQADPDEVNNLADDPKYAKQIDRMRKALNKWQRQIVDLGFLTEAELHDRFGKESPYDAVRKKPGRYPLKRIRAIADMANSGAAGNLSALVDLLRDSEPMVRYWALIGLITIGEPAAPATGAAMPLMKDQDVTVRLAAAEFIARRDPAARDKALAVLVDGLSNDNVWARLEAANILDRLDAMAQPVKPAMQAALDAEKQRKSGFNYVIRALDQAIDKLGG
ncbi:sulfatase-like hydrolase/transferase [Planctomycetales bacterium ZRK34]|nr:sulfatase-like hydrolase/transferase [Planctomycetales bacterium ZRK34]